MENNVVDLTPIFIFSLPRSGSTLLQRILAAHDSITTASEPWILLPFLYSLHDRGIYTEYRQTAAMAAIRDFIDVMPGGFEDYNKELRNFISRLYAQTTNEPASYFVDKTPRYHLIIDDIVDLFPNGKFIFMWRNPLAIISSLIESFSNGKWELYRFQVDLFKGLENLIRTSEKYKDRSAYVRYEDLVTNPETHITNVFEYLDITPDIEVISKFTSVRLQGSKGDPIGVEVYKSISTEPLDKWKKSLANPYRKLWSRHYLNWISEDRLQTMGYKKAELLDELNSVPLSLNYLVSDIYHWIFGIGYRLFEPRISKHKIQNFTDWNRIYAHT